MTSVVAGAGGGDPVNKSRPATKAPTPSARAGPTAAGRSPAAGQVRLTTSRTRNSTVSTTAGPAPVAARSSGRAVRAAQPAATTRTADRGAATTGRQTAVT